MVLSLDGGRDRVHNSLLQQREIAVLLPRVLSLYYPKWGPEWEEILQEVWLATLFTPFSGNTFKCRLHFVEILEFFFSFRKKL